MTRVVVIGGGLSGLAAACHLAGGGHEVTVVERDLEVGGRAGTLSLSGFTFDTGPTVLTMPGLVADALAAVGVDLADALTLQRLDPAYRASFADGSTIYVRAGHRAMRAEIAATCGPADAEAFDRFVPWLRNLYQLEMPHFIDANFNTPLDLLRSPSAAAQLLRLGAFRRLGPAVRRFFRDPRLHRLFSFQALYAGLAPDDALALYAVICYMDSIEGVWFPAGGMHAVPAALESAAAQAGVTFHLGQSVNRLLRRTDGGIAGVQLDSGEQLSADAVVCTVDLPVAYRQFLPDLLPPRAVRRGQYSPSAVVWHVGARGKPGPEAAHHNIHFGQAWGAAFDAMLRHGTLMPDPSRLVTVPTLSQPGLSPENTSTLFVLEPVPNLSGTVDWDHERDPMRDRLLTFLGAAGYPDDILAEQLITPPDWQRQGLELGTPFSLAHTFLQTGPFRPANVERRVPGLFFAGSGTVPGVGVPMVLISGKLAAQRVSAYLPAQRSTITTQKGHHGPR